MLSTATPQITDTAALHTEIEALRAEISRLQELAYKDQLTGVFNRRSFDERLVEEWSRGDRTQSPVALLLIDIDHFKQVNDGQGGHQAGDRLLQALGAAFNAIPRRTYDTVARYGGDEFAMILPDSSVQGAVRVAELLQAAAHECGATLSIGAASMLPSSETTVADLIQAADNCVYKSKANGRNCISEK